MTRREHSHLVIWLLALWEVCDQIYIDALLCGVAEVETVAALDDIEHELQLLGIADARSAADRVFGYR